MRARTVRPRTGISNVALAVVIVAAGACGGDGGGSNASKVPDPPEVADNDRAMHAPGMSKNPLELPDPGTYTYDVTGTSSLGALPATTTLEVEDIGQARQRWTVNRPEKDGQVVKETLELFSHYDGIRLASHRIERTTPAGPQVIELAPTNTSALYVPYFKLAPGEVSFDMASADGCYSATTNVYVREVFVPVQVGPVTFSGYHADLDQTVTGAAKAGCQAVKLVSQQTLWLDKDSRLPVLDSMKRSETGGGAGPTSEVQAAIKSTTPS